MKLPATMAVLATVLLLFAGGATAVRLNQTTAYYNCMRYRTTCKSLSVAAGRLTGSIPYELILLSKLTHLQLNNNAMTGTIPTEMGTLTDLKTL
mmetsp:Transcript_44267/g.82702  ORF Transcript_44267/g.82702 Transcript_44267/m.82702 type:complete len:94 (+) Transcript_44267:109-390(+)